MSKFVQYLIIFGIAMIPIVELRGALPVAYGFFYDWLNLLPWKDCEKS